MIELAEKINLSVQQNLERAKSEGFKQTEIGLLPVDWASPEIGEVCRLTNGRGFKPHEWRTRGIPILRIQNLNGSEEFNYYEGSYNRKIEVPYDQLLYAWSGSRGSSFGPHVWKGPFSLLNYHTWKIEHDDAKVNRDFLFHALKSLTEYIEGWAHGASALVHVQKWQMEKFKIPLPPTKLEQRAIATALSDADSLVGALDQLLEKKRLIKQGAMQELLSGRRRLPGFNGEWQTKKIGDVLAIKHGKSQHNVVAENGMYPILATGGEIGRANDYLYDKPSVLIGRKGTIDRPQYMETPFWTVDTLFYSVIRPQNSAKFFYYAFLMVDWRQFNEASGVPSLNARTIEEIELRVPLECEQVAIASVLSEIEDEIQALRQKLGKARQIKQGMMQELLTGRVRLV